ncbi:DUF305 domain-containing protein [Saccharomonospora sp. NB11]|jgi:uncharacterized protein (DUF305 family)|uniref:DUF305 domain-containing protein n=1 Tax=Saccharomonospora sp. NB11 TaxID=1642298 RepID=UPI0018D1004B|nr:DUF305 domain-containing protein [Saccharomonospora sp. NB11]
MRGALSAGVAAFLLLVTGCTAEPASESSEQAPPDVIVPRGPGEQADVLPADRAAEQAGDVRVSAADVEYMRMMIPHHEQAIVMTDLVADRAESSRLKTLAGRIADAQEGEISMMESWLDRYEDRVPDHERDHEKGHNEHGHDHAHMPGMATDEQLDALRAASGTEFDRLFCELMITHHEGALTMAEDYLPRGIEPQALAMAQEVVTTQTAEIEHLRDIMP